LKNFNVNVNEDTKNAMKAMRQMYDLPLPVFNVNRKPIGII
jgi:hypothetical protein